MTIHNDAIASSLLPEMTNTGLQTSTARTAIDEFGQPRDGHIAAERVLSEREATAAIAMDLAEVAPGARTVATEFGLGFISLGWESFDFVLPLPFLVPTPVPGHGQPSV